MHKHSLPMAYCNKPGRMFGKTGDHFQISAKLHSLIVMSIVIEKYMDNFQLA